MCALDVQDLCVSYGGIEALRGVSLRVERGRIVALIGNNGAGKSTLLRTISGLVHPRIGQVLLDGRPITAFKPHAIAALGLRHVAEGHRVFGRLSVRENLEMGAFCRQTRHALADDRDRVLTMFPVLRQRWTQLAGTLSGGEQQMLAMAQALMGQPRVLLLDEPSMGLSPLMVEQVFEIIQGTSAQGISILLVEQNALLALTVADTAHVLESGRIVLSGDADALIDDERVRSAYLG